MQLLLNCIRNTCFLKDPQGDSSQIASAFCDMNPNGLINVLQTQILIFSSIPNAQPTFIAQSNISISFLLQNNLIHSLISAKQISQMCFVKWNLYFSSLNQCSNSSDNCFNICWTLTARLFSTSAASNALPLSYTPMLSTCFHGFFLVSHFISFCLVYLLFKNFLSFS